ncbi:MAG: hypothetical protein K2V38_26890, partial [Gemmataceae bacterium]|nr:hypothetical protein [Gemmataceae bacterium]
LPRLVVLGYFRLTHDFRAGMFLQVAILSGLALYLVRLAERLRGRPHWADAFFPVSLLHVGHWENLVMGYQVCFVLYAALATLLGVVALRITPDNAFRSGLGAGALALLLALTGGSGLVVALPAGAWVGFIGWSVWRTGARGRAAVLFALATLPAAYLAVYFHGYERPPHHPAPSTDFARVLTVTGEVLAVSLGMGLSAVWGAVAVGVVAVGALTLNRVARRWKEPADRLSVAGLILVAAGVAGVALAVGVGRAGFDRWAEMGLWSRYALLTWPLLGLAFLAWVQVGRSAPEVGRGARWVPIALCVAAALAFPGNTGVGMAAGAQVKAEYAAIAADHAAGLTPEQVVDAHDRRASAAVLQRVEGRSARGIPLLGRDRVGIFAR